MVKQWDLKSSDNINCKEACAFGKICEARGSNYLYKAVIKESGDESLKEIFKKCGMEGTLSIIFLPIVRLKKGRF